MPTEHSSGRPYRNRGDLIDRHIVGRFSDRFVAVSVQSGLRLTQVVGVPAGKVEVIRNGSSRSIPDRGHPEVSRLRMELCAEGEALIGAVSMLRAQKRVDLLIDAFAAIEREFPAARLVVVGDGPEGPALRSQVAKLGLRHVRFLGQRDDVGSLLATFDIFVLSSDVEGSPLALIDAMRAGLGIVATSVGGIPDMMSPGECAILVPPNDANRLAAGIGRLLQDEPLRRQLGVAARERAEESLLVDRMVDDWSDLFCQLTGDRRSRG